MSAAVYLNPIYLNPVYLNELGIVNALGSSKRDVLDALLKGVSPGMLVDNQYLQGKPIVVGKVMIDLPEIPQQLNDYNSRTSQLLLCALQQIQPAIDRVIKKVGADRIGVVIGTSTSGIAEGEDFIASRASHHYVYRQQEIGAPALFVAEYLQSKGPCLTVSTACSSSAKVFATARNWLAMDLCDAVIVGGADSLCRLTVNGFNALGLVSGETCRPFQKDRRGINIGEAAALFLMSREEAPIRLLAVGESSDAYHISAPHPTGEGAGEAMRFALDEAGLSPADIDYINLHGTATQANDTAESNAVAKIFGHLPDDKTVASSSTKPLTGHTLGAAGATEAGLCWLLMSALNVKKIIPSQCQGTQYDETLPDIHLLNRDNPPYVLKQKSHWRMLSNSFAFGGSNACVILEKNNLEKRNLEKNSRVEDSNTLESMLPHRKPLLLLSEVLACDANSAESRVVISPDSEFYSAQDKGVPIWVGVEYMAQTIGLWNGERKRSKGEAIGLAFLLGIRDYKIQNNDGTSSLIEYFPLGADLRVHVTPIIYDEETMLGVFDCTIQASSFKISARMNAISPENPLALIKEMN